MKELNEYTAEVRRRVAVQHMAQVEYRTQGQHRLRVLAACVPLVICLIVGILVLPPLLRRTAEPGPDELSPVQMEQNQTGAGLPLAGGPADGNEAMDGELTEGVTSAPIVDGIAVDNADQSGKTEVPEDFSFRFVWGCYGISSYDSQSGELVKTTDATHPEDYVTELILSADQRREIWTILSALDLRTYPAEYDPYNAPDAEQRFASEPNRDLILTLRLNGTEQTVTCREICLGGFGLQGYDERARAFLDVCDRLTALLTGTPEWKALPEYEFYYE